MASNKRAHREPNEWWVGIVAGMASYIDAAALVANGIALVIYQQALGITPNQIGLLSATLTICVAVGSFVGGRAGDRIGRRTVFLVTMALIVIGSTLNTFASSFEMLFAGTVLVGLGVGADLPVSLASIAEAASNRNRGKLIILSNALWLVGILASVGIASAVGGQGRLGGQLLFGQVGVVAFIVMLARLGIPESRSWLEAREERITGVLTTRALHTAVRDLIVGSYAKPFFALLTFYTLTGLAASTAGQFNTFIAVNLAGSTVEHFNQVALGVLPAGVLLTMVFMRVVDTPLRMKFFLVGAAGMVGAAVVPAVWGFSMTTMVINLAFAVIGGSFAFESMLKVWAQESFPTMLRASAQGAIIAISRIVSAALAVFTPALLLSNGQAFYVMLAVTTLIGVVVAWLHFSGKSATEFDREHELAPEQPPSPTPIPTQSRGEAAL